MMSTEKKSWRDIFTIHCAANLFPMLSEDELRQLGEDIRKNGLRDPIVLWSEKREATEHELLDGRNRLDALELVGIPTVELIGDRYRLAKAPIYLCSEPNPYLPTCGGINPFAYAISKNIHRRHLTKVEQAELILKALKLEQETVKSPEPKSELAMMARSETRRFHGGNEGGSTKDPLKQKFVDKAETEGISRRTAQRVWDKDRGPQFERASPQTAPRTDIGNVAIDRIARDAINFLEPKFNNLRQSDIAQVLTAVTKHFQNGAAPTEIFYRKGKPRADIFDQRPPWEIEGNDD